MAIYIKNKDLYTEMVSCIDNSTEASEKLVEMFTLLSERISYKLSFKSEDDRKDLVSFGVMDAYNYWKGFNPKKSTNAFAYMTTVIRNGQLKGYKILYPWKQHKIMRVGIHNNYSL